VLCSSPFNACVGGTEFKDAANPGLYRSATASKTTLGSALSYIPEVVWNESGTVAGGSQLWASGGGTGIFFAKPSWQSGNGVPSDGWRHVPDVSVSATSHDGYLMYMNKDCMQRPELSASSPSWAGLMALINQQSGTSEGNANPSLYGLFQLQTAGHAAVFHLVTTGNNSIPGTPGYSAASG